MDRWQKSRPPTARSRSTDKDQRVIASGWLLSREWMRGASPLVDARTAPSVPGRLHQQLPRRMASEERRADRHQKGAVGPQERAIDLAPGIDPLECGAVGRQLPQIDRRYRILG